MLLKIYIKCTIVMTYDDTIIVHDKLQQVMETLFANNDIIEVLSLPNRSVLLCVCVCVRACVRVCSCVHACMYVCMCICVFVCVQVVSVCVSVYGQNNMLHTC